MFLLDGRPLSPDVAFEHDGHEQHIELKCKRLINNSNAEFFPGSNAAARRLGLRFYFTNKKCKFNHLDLRYTASKECRACRLNKNVKLKDTQIQWYKNNKNRVSLINKQRYYANHEAELERTRIKWKRNPSAVRARNLDWIRRNPNYWTHAAAKRRAALRCAIPSWADLREIKMFYEACPPGYHVDHIHPLQGKTVCGLHVLENLQYLTAKENLKKSNRLEF